MEKIISVLTIAFFCAFSVTAQTRKPVVKPATDKATSSFQAPMAKGKVVYTQHCLPCHQADGWGVMNLNPPLVKTAYVLGDQKRLINIILKGLTVGVVIEDEEYSNPMPPLNYLSDQQVADVLTYIRNSFGNEASAISVAQVKAVRGKK